MNFSPALAHPQESVWPAIYKTVLMLKLIALFIAILSIRASAAHAQAVTIIAKNEPIETVFKQIERQTGYSFWYKGNPLKQTQPVTVTLKGASLTDALDQIISRQPLTYQIVDRTIVINERSEKTDKAATSPPRQDVSGKVVDGKGQPLPGATVKVRGTTTVVTTDADGNFRLNNLEDQAVLIISFIGYQSREVTARGQEPLLIRMELAMAELDAATVVSTGYQELPKERATGSFSKVDNATFNRQVSTDVISRLKSVAPSIHFDQRGNTRTFLTIRGQSTIFGNDQPLIVVDNFPYEGDINNINPNDVEDITILKDAAAASIWGVRAGNGVIVITTKKGKYNQTPRVELTSNVTVGGKPDLFYEPRMSSSDFIDVEMMLFQRGFYNSSINNTITYPVLSPVVEILLKQRNGQISADQATAQINALRGYDLRNDLEKYYYQNTVRQQYALNLSGGTQRHSYYFSGGFDRNSQSQANGVNSRLSIATSQTFRPAKNLELTAVINYIEANNKQGYSTADITFGTPNRWPYARLADDQGNPLPLEKNYRQVFKDNAVNAGYLNWDFVPLEDSELSNLSSKQRTTRLSGGMRYNLVSSLSADLKFQYEYQNRDEQRYRPSDSYYMRDLINRYTTNVGSALVRNIPLGGMLSNSTSDFAALNGRAQLNFNRKWNKHEISAIGGFDVREVKTSSFGGQLLGYDPDLGTSTAVNYATLYTLYPSGGSTTIPFEESTGRTIDRYRSYYSNASYTYNKKYTASISGRIDQSNMFGVKANQRAVPLWSTGVKWDISEEAFYKLDWLSRLTLRSSFGYNGNLDNSLTAYTTAQTLATAAVPSARIVNPPNENLRWERSGIWNIGLDFTSRNDRVTGSIEYFTKRGKDIIGEGSIDPTVGVNSFKGNVVDMKGHGIDLELRVQNLRGTLQWRTDYLFSYATDEVLDYALTPTTIDILRDNSLGRVKNNMTPVTGRPVFGIYSYPWAGLDPLTGQPRGYLNGEPSTNMTLINMGINADPVGNLVYHGPALAPYFGSIRNTVTYKNIEASFNIGYRFGNYFKRSTIGYSSLYSSYSSPHGDFNLRWQKPGDEAITNVPAMIYPARSANDAYYLNSEVTVSKGDNIRLQDAALSYTLNPQNGGKLPFKSLRFSVYANNLGILWKATSTVLDPDFPTQKPIRTISFGLNCTF